MDIKLKCACGAIQGVAIGITPDSCNRVVCCCNDCQTFADYLKHDSKILDEFGGTEIIQTSQGQVKINKGSEHLRCLRLTPKGLVRWYAGCCKTPIGNTMNANFPFIGLIHNFLHIKGPSERALGPIRAYMQTKYARGVPSYPHSAKGFPLRVTLRVARKMAQWKIKGMDKPSVFFNDDGKPVVKPTILD